MKWISDLLDIILPRYCAVCGSILSSSEKDLCLNCLYQLPRVEPIHAKEIEKLFWGIIPVEKASSYIYYRKGSPYNGLIHKLKYRNAPHIGVRLGAMAADEMLPSGFFDDITLIVPLPLSRKKQRKRGYNQCDYIARGISERTGIPVATDLIKRTKANETQTHKTRDERWQNVEGIFTVTKPQAMEGQHILLVDDILTTGATLCSCVDAIKSSCDCKVSILTLALTYNGI